MTALVLHYDPSPHAVCEATGLLAPAPALRHVLGGAAPALPRERLVVLVSPSYYKQRAAFYGSHRTVKPLLRWHMLSADHLERIMRVKEGDSQLYVASLLDLLRCCRPALLSSDEIASILPAFGDSTVDLWRKRT